MFKGIIFDFDGTLFDSMSIWQHVGSTYVESHGLISDPDLDKKIACMSREQSAEVIKKDYSLDLSIEEIIKGYNEIIEDFYYKEAVIKPGVYDCLQRLKENNIKMCIATVNESYIISDLLKKFNIDNCISSIITATEVGSGKDNPYIFRYSADKLGINKNEVVVVEDSLYAAKTAKADNFAVIGVYDFFAQNKDVLKDLVDLYIESFEDDRVYKFFGIEKGNHE